MLAGDVLTRCSATVLKTGAEGEFEKEGYGKTPYNNWERGERESGCVCVFVRCVQVTLRAAAHARLLRPAHRSDV